MSTTRAAASALLTAVAALAIAASGASADVSVELTRQPFSDRYGVDITGTQWNLNITGDSVANVVTIAWDADGIAVSDPVSAVTPADGCTASDPHTVVCEPGLDPHATALLGAGADRLVLAAPLALDAGLGDGDDRFLATDGSATVDGGTGADVLTGGPGDDRLSGGEGDSDDDLRGGGGDDALAGGSGDDRLTGDDGDDLLAGGTGGDRVSGDDGIDRVVLGAADGPDALDGGAGDDMLAIGTSTLRRLRVDLRRTGLPGGSTMRSFEDVDADAPGGAWLTGTAGDNELLGTSASDRLEGLGGDDLLDGRALEPSVDDVIDGGSGDDVLVTITGSGDRVVCGRGRDLAETSPVSFRRRARRPRAPFVVGCEALRQRGVDLQLGGLDSATARWTMSDLRLRSGRPAVAYRCDVSCSGVTLDVRSVRGRLLARARFAERDARIRLRKTAAGRRELARAREVRIDVSSEQTLQTDVTSVRWRRATQSGRS